MRRRCWLLWRRSGVARRNRAVERVSGQEDQEAEGQQAPGRRDRGAPPATGKGARGPSSSRRRDEAAWVARRLGERSIGAGREGCQSRNA